MNTPLVLNGRFLSQPLTGVQRYAHETLAALDRLLASGAGGPLRATLLAPPGAPLPPLQAIAGRHCGQRQGHAWEQLDLPRHSRDALLLNFGFTGPLAARRQLITVHDGAVLRVPQSYSLAFRLGYRALVGRLARQAERVLAVSAFAAGEATACFGAPAARVRQVTEGWQHMTRIVPDDSVLDRHGLRGQAFLLAVSSPTPSKNFGLIARALDLLGEAAPLCVVVGGLSAGLAAGVAAHPRLRAVGRVSDAELKALYGSARGFVFPSLYEGFGIPPLEAMACGCPVLASTAPAVAETCGDAALAFDPQDADALATAIRRLWDEPALRHQLLDAAARRLQHFSWDKGARLHLDALLEVL